MPVTVPQLRKWAEAKYRALSSTSDPREYHYRDLIDWCSWAKIGTIQTYLNANKSIATVTKNLEDIKIIEGIKHFIETGEEDNDRATC